MSTLNSTYEVSLPNKLIELDSNLNMVKFALTVGKQMQYPFGSLEVIQESQKLQYVVTMKGTIGMFRQIYVQMMH